MTSSSTGGEAERVKRDALLDLTPDEDERRRLERTWREVEARTTEALERRGVDGDVALVGSAARDTWMSGDRDVDVFILLPPGLDRDEFERLGLDVGHEVLPEGETEYAEHPYVKGTIDGFDVDLVPCYALDSPREIRSAVDRTPFHQDYVVENAPEGFGEDVRLLKALARSAGVYGSDLRTRGFGGYLLELLVLHYGGFDEVVEAAADWTPPVEIEFETPEKEFEGSLVVVDPVDPGRDVASVVSDDAVAVLQDRCREWLSQPRPALFEVERPKPLEPSELHAALERRGTTTAAVVFDAPDVVEDQLYPQLRKTRAAVVEELERRGFDVLRATSFADEHAVVYVELSVATLPEVERHVGPPVHVRGHADEFKEKYADGDVTGPFVSGGRYVVERPRDVCSAVDFLRSRDLLRLSLGRDVERAMERGYDVYVDGEVEGLLDEFGVELRRYYEPPPTWRPL